MFRKQQYINVFCLMAVKLVFPLSPHTLSEDLPGREDGNEAKFTDRPFK